MKKRLNKKSTIVLIGIAAFIILLFYVIYALFLKGNNAIKFNDEYNEIEYGETLDYKKAIKSVTPSDTKIEYPDVEVKDVGTYHLTFRYKFNGREKTQDKEFIVKDTKLPKIIVRNNDTVEVALNSQYDVFANIVSIKNLSEEAINNKVSVSSEDYNKLRKKTIKENEKILNRKISSKKDIKDFKTERNMIIYTTDFNHQVEGDYSIKVLTIDENYNMGEAKWKLKVVPNDNLVNSGGSVSCVYPTDSIQSGESYTTEYEEVYYYNEDKLVNNLDFKTIMTFNEGYNTNENADILLAAINQKYVEYNKHSGVVVNAEYNSDAIITKIQLDFTVYDIANDPLSLLETKNAGKVRMEKVLLKLKDKATCDINI